MHRSFFVMTVFLLAGCSTTLRTVPVSPTQERIVGGSYALPHLEMKITVTRRLIECQTVKQTNGDEEYYPKFAFELKAEPTYPAAEWFSMDYNALAGPTKTSSFSLETYDNHVIKSVNVEVDDKSVEIAGEVIKTGFGAARLAAGIPPVAAYAKGNATCPDALLNLRDTALGKQKALNQRLADRTAKIAALNLRAAAAPLSKKERSTLKDLVNEADGISKQLAAEAKTITDADKRLAYTEILYWTPDPSKRKNGELTDQLSFELQPAHPDGRDAARALWIEGLFGVTPSDLAAIVSVKNELEKLLALTGSVRVPGGDAARDSARTRLGLVTRATTVTEKAKDSIHGIVSRIPLRANVRLCQGVNATCSSTPEMPLFETVTEVPQFAPYEILPYHNGLGENNVIKAEFSPMGSKTKISFESKRAVALEAAKVGAAAMGEAVEFAKARRAERKAETEEAEAKSKEALNAPNEALERQLKGLETQQKIAASEARLDPANKAADDELERLKHEVESLKYQVEKATALKLLNGSS